MKILKSILLLIVLGLPAYGYAQGFEEDEDVIDQVPLDGGLSLLAASGAAYGLKKWHELRHKKEK